MGSVGEFMFAVDYSLLRFAWKLFQIDRQAVYELVNLLLFSLAAWISNERSCVVSMVWLVQSSANTRLSCSNNDAP